MSAPSTGAQASGGDALAAHPLAGCRGARSHPRLNAAAAAGSHAVPSLCRRSLHAEPADVRGSRARIDPRASGGVKGRTFAAAAAAVSHRTAAASLTAKPLLIFRHGVEPSIPSDLSNPLKGHSMVKNARALLQLALKSVPAAQTPEAARILQTGTCKTAMRRTYTLCEVRQRSRIGFPACLLMQAKPADGKDFRNKVTGYPDSYIHHGFCRCCQKLFETLKRTS